MDEAESEPAVEASEEQRKAEHRRHAAETNNAAWPLLGKVASGETLSGDEAHELLSLAFASAYHWANAADSGPANEARALWMVSRAATVTGNGELGLTNAERSLAVCVAKPDGVADFDVAYAKEAVARSLACLGRLDQAAEALAAAQSAPIADDQDRALVESDIAAPPWFDLEA